MAKAPSKNAKAQLALALAQGRSAAKWARANEASKMTAYRWANDPKVSSADRYSFTTSHSAAWDL